MKPVDPRLLRHARATRGFLVGSVLLGLLNAGLVIAQAVLIADIVVGSFQGGLGSDEPTGPVALLAATAVGRALVSWLTERAAHRAGAAVKSELRMRLVEHAAALGPGRLDHRRSGELAVLAGRGIDALDDYFARYLPQLGLAVAVPAAVLAVILIEDRVSAAIILGTLPLIPLFMVLIGWATRSHMDRQWRRLTRLSHHFLDVVAGLPTLKVFGRSRAQVENIRAITADYRRTTVRTLRLAFLSSFALELLATISVALVAVTIGMRLVHGEMDLHTGLVVLILAPEAYLPLRQVGTHYHAAAEGLSAADEVFGVLGTERPRPGTDPAPDARTAELRLERVTVRREGRAGEVLREVDLTLRPGETVAVVGPSGAGKTTLINVLLGFVRPEPGGRVLVGDRDLADLDPASWHRQVAWVPQHPHLFAGTIAENVRLARPDADDEAVRRALRDAAADADLPPERRVEEGGTGLSAGQRQRVALARALLTERPVLLLDEPTAALDGLTEARVRKALRGAAAGRTVLIVTHRPALRDLADRVVELPPPTPLPAETAGAGSPAGAAGAAGARDTGDAGDTGDADGPTGTTPGAAGPAEPTTGTGSGAGAATGPGRASGTGGPIHPGRESGSADRRTAGSAHVPGRDLPSGAVPAAGAGRYRVTSDTPVGDALAGRDAAASPVGGSEAPVPAPVGTHREPTAPGGWILGDFLGAPADGDTPTDPAATSTAGPAARAPRRLPPIGRTTGARRLLRDAARPRAGRLVLTAAFGALALASATGLMAVSGWLISRASEQPPVLYLMIAVTLTRTFGIGRAVFRYVERLLGHDAVLRMLADLRVTVYGRLERLAPAGLRRTRRGDLLSRLVSDVDALQDHWLRWLLPAGAAAVVSTAAVIFTGWLLPGAGAVLAAGLLAAGVGVPLLTGAIARRTERRLAPARGRLGTRVVDLLTGTGELTVAGALPGRIAAVRDSDRELTGLAARSGSATASAAGLGALAAGLTVAAAARVGADGVASGALAGVWLATVVMVPLAAFEAVNGLSVAVQHRQRAGRATERVAEVLDTPDPVREPAEPAEPPAGPFPLVVRGLTARHPGQSPDAAPALSGVDLELTPGRRIAVVGASGAGKTTLALCLLRFLDPEAGGYTLAGVDATSLRGEDVRRMVGLCAQDAHLFDSTLRENLRLARPGATDGELRAVLRRARLLEWVDELPAGLDTSVGEHGAELSGGQRQRLALARALLADFPVLLLDEPAEHLDTDTADALTADLLAATADRTTLLITHRLVGLEEVDELLVLDGGRVVQRGPHAELARRPGPFRRMLRAADPDANAGADATPGAVPDDGPPGSAHLTKSHESRTSGHSRLSSRVG
ncbi:thiol reductant ABC exporter subunit CydD [Streptomyces sp. ST2-7A]|uniref:thiol reductant ABC exporter subunit CydD n=1 Tax=Streptomyces sp. ST2-7A TaxID=2907214 RepID=UPI001F20D709|nr:thiol reductant ABC exporter subunit CydD [Streptomyces sp. ST2-7A]MCE7081454.1 thiol reductant ABC exporter subunit CydD [Streptomyces sp. ST2-7A]